ncbi:MAG: hypothetical protein Ct9H300mP11_25590 [Chloroflexota bacterium]|nr:MAG: hypothetical protein Ct9H300mP11_25590 [Chloroflexota bacterium]
MVTCPVDFYSRVKVDLYAGKHGIEAPEGCEKTGAAVRRTLVQLKNAKVRARLTIKTPYPGAREWPVAVLT